MLADLWLIKAGNSMDLGGVVQSRQASMYPLRIKACSRKVWLGRSGQAWAALEHGRVAEKAKGTRAS